MMMWRSAALVVVMLVVAMAAVAMAAVPGPKNPRYPDNIVEPKVKCSSEGVFPHPRNCSWYYRCVDRMKVGFYYTYLFECGPGTVFADDLDQCVFPFMTAPPCGTGTGVPPITLPTPRPTVPTTRPTVPTPTPTVPTPRPTPPTPRPTPPTPRPTPPTPRPTVPTPTSTSPVIQCAFRDTSCQTYQVCQPTRATKTLCNTCYVANTIPIQANDICGAEQLIDKALNQCVPRPKATDLCPASTTPPPTVPITSTNVLRCSDQQTRPKEDWIVSRYCQVFALCDANKTFKGRQELCTNYYQCNKNPNGSWSFELRNCLPPLMYSFTTDSCVPRPSANELC
ncbi:zonadhesin [Procambarus clarkii]|uniref:zonadhesin n=1 Tax=Procambarus clarkii TaxID=6728 RepID=UPI003743918D